MCFISPQCRWQCVGNSVHQESSLATWCLVVPSPNHAPRFQLPARRQVLSMSHTAQLRQVSHSALQGLGETLPESKLSDPSQGPTWQGGLCEGHQPSQTSMLILLCIPDKSVFCSYKIVSDFRARDAGFESCLNHLWGRFLSLQETETAPSSCPLEGGNSCPFCLEGRG